MNTYVVTLQGVRGEVIVQADGFYGEGEGAITFFREKERTVGDCDDPQALLARFYRDPVLSYAHGIWRSVMLQGAGVEFKQPLAQGRATRENSNRRQEA